MRYVVWAKDYVGRDGRWRMMFLRQYETVDGERRWAWSGIAYEAHEFDDEVEAVAKALEHDGAIRRVSGLNVRNKS